MHFLNNTNIIQIHSRRGQDKGLAFRIIWLHACLLEASEKEKIVLLQPSSLDSRENKYHSLKMPSRGKWKLGRGAEKVIGIWILDNPILQKTRASSDSGPNSLLFIREVLGCLKRGSERMWTSLHCPQTTTSCAGASSPWVVPRTGFAVTWRWFVNKNSTTTHALEVILNVMRGLYFLCLWWVSRFAKKPKHVSNPSYNINMSVHHS